MTHRNQITVSVQPETGIIFSLIILLIPLKWVFAWFFATLFHEACHVLMIVLCGKCIRQVDVSVGGMILRSETLSPFQNILCSLAGPAGGFFLVFFACWFPRIAICGFLQSVYNLLPIYPLDGSHVLYAFCRMMLTDAVAKKLAFFADWFVTLLLTVCSIYLAVACKIGILPLAFGVMLLIRKVKIKIPFKEAFHRVQ